ncbi:MAG: zinc-finger domain-containing protein [Caedimonas sp.]|nr:zinc-finger domain-containing protein [Caedimonas sp.]
MNAPIIYVETPSVVCDGNESPSGHPRVYLDLEKRGEIICPYCSRHFILKQESQSSKNND